MTGLWRVNVERNGDESRYKLKRRTINAQIPPEVANQMKMQATTGSRSSFEAASCSKSGRVAVSICSIPGQGATGVTLSVSLPKGSKFVSATGAKYTTDKGKIVFSPVVVQPNKTLQCKLQVSMENPGSKIAIAAIKFNELQGKIVVTERTHVLPENIDIPKSEDVEWDDSEEWDE